MNNAADTIDQAVNVELAKADQYCSSSFFRFGSAAKHADNDGGGSRPGFDVLKAGKK